MFLYSICLVLVAPLLVALNDNSVAATLIASCVCNNSVAATQIAIKLCITMFGPAGASS